MLIAASIHVRAFATCSTASDGDGTSAVATSTAATSTCPTWVHTITDRRSCASMNEPPTNVPAMLPASPESPSRPTAAGEPVSAYTCTYNPTRANWDPSAEMNVPVHRSR